MILYTSELKPGMKLEHTVYSDDNKVLLSSDTILTIKNIEKLKEYRIETIEVADRNTLFISPTDKMQESLVDDFIKILRETVPNRREANKNDKVMKVAEQLEIIIHKIAKKEEVLNFLVELRIIDKQRLYDHSIYTAVLSGIIAGCLELGIEELISVVIGGLIHNIGMAEMPTLVKCNEFNNQQRSLYKEHPTYGYYFALQKDIPRVIANCIQFHHEKWNGSGFPKGISGEEIPILARIISVCANYSAAVIYKNIPPYMAVEELYGASGVYYDPKVVSAFVNNIPIYPLGVMVRLSTKEVGIVSNIRKNEGPRPVVKIYFNRVNRPITEDKIVDLGIERTIFIEEIL